MLITAPDGYNGHTIQLDTDRVVKEDADMICLRVAGSDYLIGWVRKADMQKQIGAAMKENVIEIKDGRIVIQSCTDSWANVGVFSNGRCAYRHVAVPSLIREYGQVYHNDLPTVEFDRILGENRQRLLDAINRLSA